MSIYSSVLQSVAKNEYYENKVDMVQSELIDEIKFNGDVKTIANLISNGASKNRELKGETPLSAAIKHDQFDAFSYLLDNLKADPEHQFKYINGKYYPLVWYSLWDNKMPFFKMLLNQSKKNLRDPENNQTLLIAATKLVNVEAVAQCINSNKMDVNAVDINRKTALHYALSVSQNKMTPDHQDIINMLINAGANPELKDIDNNKPLDIYNKMTEVEKLQIQAEMEMANKKDKPKNTKKYGMSNKKRGQGVK